MDDFIANKIVYAQEEMIRLGLQLLYKTKPNIIMVVGLNLVLERLFV